MTRQEWLQKIWKIHYRVEEEMIEKRKLCPACGEKGLVDITWVPVSPRKIHILKEELNNVT